MCVCVCVGGGGGEGRGGVERVGVVILIVEHLLNPVKDRIKDQDVSVAEWLTWLTSICGRIGAIGSSPSNGLKPNL